jgi:hypothetical protein
MNDSTQTQDSLVATDGLEFFEALGKEGRNRHLLIVVLLSHFLALQFQDCFLYNSRAESVEHIHHVLPVRHSFG